MATIVESRTLKLRLSSSKPLPPPHQSIDLSFKSCFRDSNNNEENTNKTDTFKPNNNMGNSWSFLDALSDVSQGNKESSQKETTYVPPQQKRSSLLLSPKSLELCTENLGNESGTDIADENDIDLFCSGGNLGTRRQPRLQRLAAKKARTQNFPPPLTTIRGSESLLVRPHREDGRLVIEVTKVPPPSPSCFQAERSHGRLRLCFLTNQPPSFDPEEEEEAEEENEDVNVIDNNEFPTPNKGFEVEFDENDMSGQIQHAEVETGDKTEEETEEKTEEETGEEATFAACGGCDEMKESNVRMEKYERLRRCKEGGDRENSEVLLNWSEPFWVTI
ncbi:protein FANTASTIC FOUR 3-like [Lotus japonicus]|uniref:protein FANTASTIC FOUR 3-like n=1 Tax=Lotus japonicus TaxID=34305 RepID=UPI002586FA8B|nr:protein FANTASTIC FOUR 3-like [Lotus japonicus]